MPTYLSPIGNSPQTSTSGAPLSGGLIYTYQAGTTTPTATYTDNTGGTPQANPIVLNTYGLPASPIWLQIAQATKFVIKDSLGNTIRTIDNVVGIDDPVPITQAQKTSVPAFSAYQSAAQSLPNNTATKIQFQTKEFDTANAFDAATNYRFQPQVPGYYQISGALAISATTTNFLALSIYKNGASFKRGGQSKVNAAGVEAASALIFLNGSTDYVELFGTQDSGGATNALTGADLTYFQAVLARAA